MTYEKLPFSSPINPWTTELSV